jgi:FMN phosphatase YigB (HAD superfamily)
METIEKITRIKGVISDYDGVLIPSPMNTMIRIRRAAKEVKTPIPGIKIIRECWGQTLEEIFSKFVKAGFWTVTDSQRVTESFNIIHHEPFPEIPGAMKTLSQLKRMDIELALISSRNGQILPGPHSPSLSATAEQAKIDLKIFGHIQAAEDYEFMKPDPRVFGPTLLHFHKLGIEQNEILVIGDTVDYDFMAAHNHQPPLQFVGINSMISPPSAFITAGLPKELILERITDLPKILPLFPLK